MKMQILGSLLVLVTAVTAHAQTHEKPMVMGDVKLNAFATTFYGKIACDGMATPEKGLGQEIDPNTITPMNVKVAIATGTNDNFNLSGDLLGETVSIDGLSKGIVRISVENESDAKAARVTSQGELKPGNKKVGLNIYKDGYMFSISCSLLK